MTHSTADAAKRERDAALARKTPMLARCPACDHEWPVCYLPMPLEQAGQLMRSARCPKGCAASPVVGGRS